MNGEQIKNWWTVCFLAGSLCSPRIGQAAELMAAPQENAVVQKYCGSCHSDALMYGGLSVQHFDAARPDPTLAAMLLSKITNGHTPKDVSAADSAQVLKMMKAWGLRQGDRCGLGFVQAADSWQHAGKKFYRADLDQV